MTVLDSTPRDQYTASGGQTVFTYTFEIAAAGDIKVLQNGTLINQGAGAGEYAVSGVGVDTGGNVTLVTGATAGDILTIYRDMALERLTAYTNAGDFLAADVNNDFDRLWLALQQNGGDLDGRVLIAPNTDPTGIDMTIPDKATRLDKYLKFNVTTGNPEVTDAAELYTSAGLNNYNFTGDGTTVNFTLGMAPGGENNTQVYIDGVYQQKNTYNVSGAIVQFSAAPPSLSTIEVMVIEVLPIGSTTASQVSFTQAGSTYGRNVQLKLQESVSVKDFGATGDGVTDDTAAIQAAVLTNSQVYYPSGTYLVTNFHKKVGDFHFGDYAYWKVGSVSTPIPLYNDLTWAAYTVYVNASTGSDSANSGLTATTAYATIQYAWDSLPQAIHNYVTIQLAAGTYNTSNRTAASMPRPAILVANKKYVARRSAQDSPDLDAYVLIKGNTKADTFIKTTSEYLYGVYCSGSEIGLDDVTVQADHADTLALVTGHRAGYVHMLDSDVVGNSQADIGISAESTGMVECVNGDVSGCTANDIFVFANSFVSFAGTGTVGSIGVKGDINVATGATVTGAISVAAGGNFDGSGGVSSRLTLSGAITVTNGTFTAVYSDITGTITGYASSLYLNASAFSKSILLYGGAIRLNATDSYVSPATASTVTVPITLSEGAGIYKDATTELIALGGATTAESYTRAKVSPNANAFDIPITLTGEVTVMEVNATGANRTACTLGAVQGVFSGTPAPVSAILHMINSDSSYNTQIVDGANAVIPAGAINIGSLSGGYSGITWVFNSDLGKWVVAAVGILN